MKNTVIAQKTTKKTEKNYKKPTKKLDYDGKHDYDDFLTQYIFFIKKLKKLKKTKKN